MLETLTVAEQVFVIASAGILGTLWTCMGVAVWRDPY